MVSITKRLLVGFILGVICFSTVQSLNYRDESAWEGMCKSGKKQSPINIETNKLECSDYDSFALSLEDTGKISFEYKNKAWVPILEGSFGDFEAEDINDIIQVYESSGAGLHIPSEHQIDGKTADIELQLEFDLSKARTHSSTDHTKAILSILFNRIDENTQEKDIVNAYDMFILQDNKGENPVVSLRIPKLLAKLSLEQQNYVMYQGSTTRPACEENVNWYVIEVPILVKDNEFDFLFNKGDFKSNVESNRAIKPLNDRPLRKICGVTSRIETLFQNPAFYFLTILIAAGYFLWQSYGRIPPEEGKIFYANTWTMHPIVSIVHVPNKQSFSRRCRIALLYVTWMVQMLIECISFRIQGYYRENSMVYFAILGVLFSIPATYALGFFFRMYSKRANENERFMHYDPTAMNRYMRIFKLSTLCTLGIGIIFLYWQIAYLVGILATQWILSFLIGVAIDLCILDCIIVVLSFKSEQLANLLKLRGYYFEGDISFYNIL